MGCSERRFAPPLNQKPGISFMGTLGLEDGTETPFSKPITGMKYQMKKLALTILAASAGFVFAAAAQDYDVVINNGRVMDPETNFDGVRNVGIKDGKIVVITEEAITGKETINAKGHVVAPGFIEGHQHATDPFSRKVNLRDGLTTQMDFEAGAGDIANRSKR